MTVTRATFKTDPAVVSTADSIGSNICMFLCFILAVKRENKEAV